MGWAYNGTCYRDGAEALTHFRNSFPMVTATGVVYEADPVPEISASGVLLFYLKEKTLSSSTTPGVTTYTGTQYMQLRACDYNDITLGADYGFSVFIGCALMFALGFIGTR